MAPREHDDPDPDPGVAGPPSMPDDTVDGRHPELAVTGERTLPDVPDENYWFQRHVAAYRHVGEHLRGTVVDAGCGEGYGLVLLREAGARGVIGVDNDPATVAHARQRYTSDRIDVVEADLLDLPLVDATMDVVVSLQVIEHIAEVDRYLAELARICRPEGQVVLTTPNATTFSPGSPTPVNPFHVREYDAAELAETLAAAGLEVTRMLGVQHDPTLATALAEQAGPDWMAAMADPASWSPRLRALVHAVTAEDFHVTEDVQASLDLVAWTRIAAT